MATQQSSSIYIGVDEFSTDVTCPYCGEVGHYTVKRFKPTAVTCDVESGGCDRYFVVTVKLQALVTTHSVDS